MTIISMSLQEILTRLRKIHTARQSILKQLAVLQDAESDLLTRLQEQNGVKSVDIPDFSMFKETTQRLLIEFWKAPNRMLFHEDIRQDVIGDDDASEETIRQTISRAKRELVKMKCPFEIKNIKKTGYRLANINVTKRDKTVKHYKTR